jgi:hypothetical protein
MVIVHNIPLLFFTKLAIQKILNSDSPTGWSAEIQARDQPWGKQAS